MADKPEKGYRPDLWEKGRDGTYAFKGSAAMAHRYPLLPPEIRDYVPPTKKPRSGGGSGGAGASGTRDMQLGSDLDPKALMKRGESDWESEGGRAMKKGGAVKSASARADGCAMRGKTRGKIV